MMSGYQRLGDWLVQNGLLTEEQRDHALSVHVQGNKRFGEVIVDLGFATEERIADCLALQYDIPKFDHKSFIPSKEALRLVSPTFAISRLMLPVKVTENEFHCAISDPLDIQATDYLTRAIGKRLVLSISTPTIIFQTISAAYANPDKVASQSAITAQQEPSAPTPKPTQTPEVKTSEEAAAIFAAPLEPVVSPEPTPNFSQASPVSESAPKIPNPTPKQTKKQRTPTSAKSKPKSTKPKTPRKPKIDSQPDRKELLASVTGANDATWNWYQGS